MATRNETGKQLKQAYDALCLLRGTLELTASEQVYFAQAEYGIQGLIKYLSQ